MTAPSVKEVIENVFTLEHDYAHFREAAQTNGDVYALRKLPKLPKDLARTEAVYMLSQDVSDEVKTLSAFMLAMQTRVTVLPLADQPGIPIKESQNKKANALEKNLALAWLNINPNRMLEAAMIWRQMVHPVGAFVMELNDWDRLGDFPICVYDVDIDGCGWQESKGQPTAFGRHYRQRMREMQKSFANRPGGKEGGTPYMDGNKLAWSDDYSVRDRPSQQSNTSNKAFPEVEMAWYADDEYITYVALNSASPKFQIGPVRWGTSNDREGMIVWQGPNPFGRVPVFLCSGDWTPLREVRDSRRAFLEEYISVTQQLNVIASIRATAARNRASSRNYIKPDPDSYALWMKQNPGKPMPALQWKDGETPFINGEMLEVPGMVDPDLDKQEAALEARRQRLQASGFTKLLDPQVVKDATLGAWLGAWDAGNQKVSAPTGRRDIAVREMFEAIEHCLTWIHGQNPSLASFELTGAGSWVKAGGERLKTATSGRLDYDSIDFPHKVNVTTQSNTIAQQLQMFAMMLERAQPLPDGRPGVFIYQDMWDAIDEDDPNTRRTTMATEGLMAEVAVPLVHEIVKAAVGKSVELDANQVVPPQAQQMPPPTARVVGGSQGA